MSKKCEITGKGALAGNNVSHANNKTKRRFLPNIQKITTMSKILDKKMSFKVCVSTIRTIEKHGGIDEFLLQAKNSQLSDEARILKKQITQNLQKK